MNFEDRVREIVEPLILDDDQYWSLSPCLLKRALIELLVIARGAESPIVDDLVFVIASHRFIPGSEQRIRDASRIVHELCLRYLSSVVCVRTPEEILMDQTRLEILRGGVRPGSIERRILLSKLSAVLG